MVTVAAHWQSIQLHTVQAAKREKREGKLSLFASSLCVCTSLLDVAVTPAEKKGASFTQAHLAIHPPSHFLHPVSMINGNPRNFLFSLSLFFSTASVSSPRSIVTLGQTIAPPLACLFSRHLLLLFSSCVSFLHPCYQRIKRYIFHLVPCAFYFTLFLLLLHFHSFRIHLPLMRNVHPITGHSLHNKTIVLLHQLS